MKKCGYCQTISAVSQESEVESVVCRLCGNLEFVDVSEEELERTMKSLVRLERCCPNPGCAPRLLTNEDKYCSKCGKASEKTSLDLWIRKCVRPVFIVDPARLFTDTLTFIETGRKLGFPGERSTAKLEEVIQQWTGQPFGVTAEWVSIIKERLEAFSGEFSADRLSSKKMYRAACEGKTVVAYLLGMHADSGSQRGEKQIILTADFNGNYMGFQNRNNCQQLWIYPIPNLEFSDCDFSQVFSGLTKEAYSTGGFEPQKAFVIDDNDPKLWSLSSIRECRKRLIPGLTALAYEKGLKAELTGKILKSFFFDRGS